VGAGKGLPNPKKLTWLSFFGITERKKERKKHWTYWLLIMLFMGGKLSQKELVLKSIFYVA